jgi:hypothetical protein
MSRQDVEMMAIYACTAVLCSWVVSRYIALDGYTLGLTSSIVAVGLLVCLSRLLGDVDDTH